MPHPDHPNETGTGVGAARVALVAFAALWVALVVWAVRNDERLFARSPEPPSAASRVVASGALPDDGPVDAAGAGEDVYEDADEAEEPSGSETDAVTGLAADAGTEAVDEAATATDASAEPAAVADPNAEAAPAIDEPPASDRPEPDALGSVELLAGAEPVDDGGVPAGAEASEAATPVESPFEARRREELETLATLLGDVTFEPLSDTLTGDARRPLERAFEILFLYPRTRVDLVVESRETSDPVEDRLLGGARAARLVDYLISRGIARERLFAGTGDGRGLPFGEHRVRVSVEDEER